MEDVQGVSQETLNTVLAGIAALTGVASIWLSIKHHRQRTAEREEDHLLAEEQLRLAQEQSELRPRLVVSLKEVVFHFRPPDSASPYEQAAVVFNIANTGRSAAHNVRCDFRLEGQHLVPDDMYGENRDFFAPHMGPTSTLEHAINVSVRVHGWTKAYYRCTCDEVGETTDIIEFQVPKRDHP